VRVAQVVSDLFDKRGLAVFSSVTPHVVFSVGVGPFGTAK
jgi:hypothetical protein